MINIKKFALACRSVGFSPDGKAIAVGMKNGYCLRMVSCFLLNEFAFQESCLH